MLLAIVLYCSYYHCRTASDRYRAVLHQIAAAMKNPYLQIQELANNVVSASPYSTACFIFLRCLLLLSCV